MAGSKSAWEGFSTPCMGLGYSCSPADERSQLFHWDVGLLVIRTHPNPPWQPNLSSTSPRKHCSPGSRGRRAEVQRGSSTLSQKRWGSGFYQNFSEEKTRASEYTETVSGYRVPLCIFLISGFTELLEELIAVGPSHGLFIAFIDGFLSFWLHQCRDCHPQYGSMTSIITECNIFFAAQDDKNLCTS